MKQLQAVSFPRSGVSIFCKILEDYYAEKKKDNTAYFCNWIGCCSHKQCCPKSTKYDLDFLYMKRHDFNGRTKNIEDKDIIYVILYRKSALEQMNAYFRYSHDNKKFHEPDRRKEDYQKCGKRDKFIAALQRKNHFAYHNSFTKKWIMNNKNPNTYYLEYDEFMSDPLKHMTKILSNFDEVVDVERLSEILKKFDVRKRFDIKESVYYIEDFNEKYKLNDVIVDKNKPSLN